MSEVVSTQLAPGPPAYRPTVSFAVLTWGDHLDLIQRCLESIWRMAPGDGCEILVAANDPSPGSRAWLEEATAASRIHRLILSERNLLKIPMMRRLLGAAQGEYFWWFDDDSHVTDATAFSHWWAQVQASSPLIVGWGATAYTREFDGFQDPEEAGRWVSEAPWFRGQPPPGTSDGPDAWWFLTGGCWCMRTSALRAMDWPDPRLVHVSEDILLGEAVRQQGWYLANIVNPGVAISDAPRRGEAAKGVPRWNLP